MSSQAATARGLSPTLLSCIEMTKICDSAYTKRWRNWSSPVSACFQKDSSTWSWPALPVGLVALMAASAACQVARCEAAGLASCSSIQAL